MTSKHVLVLGTGSSGTAAARTLAPREDVRVTLVDRADETPTTRMLVKGVAFGPTPPELIALPLPPVETVADTVTEVDVRAQQVQLASGARLLYDELVVATGSAPRPLPDRVLAAEGAGADRVRSLHSLQDALHIRELLTGLGRPARVAIHGGGLIAAETASTLRANGHEVTMIARSAVPGIGAFGAPVAERLAADHAAAVRTRFGRTIRRVDTTASHVDITLDHGDTVEADLLLVALGTTPAPPAPWRGGIDVDDRLRTGTHHVLAAGGVAVHHDDPLGTWRIDHWEDAAAQGVHAAAVALHDLGLGDDPGPYRPRSPYMATVHGRMVSGVGTTAGADAALEAGEAFVVRHERDGVVVGDTGIDAVATVYPWGPRLHLGRA